MKFLNDKIIFVYLYKVLFPQIALFMLVECNEMFAIL